MKKQDPTGNNVTSNYLIDALPKLDRDRLLPKMVEVALDLNSVIYSHAETIRHAYFPTSGLLSLRAAADNRWTVDIGMVGREGMVGLSLFLGGTKSLGVAIVQGEGTALRIAAADFIKECEHVGTLARVLKQYARSLFAQIAQTAVCCRAHPVVERLGFTLLMMSDRMEDDRIDATQEFLSKMLGVRREAVSKAVGTLEDAGLIGHSRGEILITDRKGLKAASCSCYATILKTQKPR
jgi:CRP-like cAMP-binding protein